MAGVYRKRQRSCYRITMSLKRPFVPKSDVKQWFTITTFAEGEIFFWPAVVTFYPPHQRVRLLTSYPHVDDFTQKLDILIWNEHERIAPAVVNLKRLQSAFLIRMDSSLEKCLICMLTYYTALYLWNSLVNDNPREFLASQHLAMILTGCR